MPRIIGEEEFLEGDTYGYRATVQFISAESFRSWMARYHESAFRAKLEQHPEIKAFSLSIAPQEYPDAHQKPVYQADVTLSASVTLSRKRLSKPKRVKLRKLCRSLLSTAFLVVSGTIPTYL
jgi:hypothetical protein